MQITLTESRIYQRLLAVRVLRLMQQVRSMRDKLAASQAHINLLRKMRDSLMQQRRAQLAVHRANVELIRKLRADRNEWRERATKYDSRERAARYVDSIP